jgi:hypothetical protein
MVSPAGWVDAGIFVSNLRKKTITGPCDHDPALQAVFLLECRMEFF